MISVCVISIIGISLICLNGVKFKLNPLGDILVLSAACFASWNYAFKVLGVVKTSIYIYVVPVITVFISVLVLKEPFTLFTLTGTLLTILGLFISKKK